MYRYPFTESNYTQSIISVTKRNIILYNKGRGCCASNKKGAYSLKANILSLRLMRLAAGTTAPPEYHPNFVSLTANITTVDTTFWTNFLALFSSNAPRHNRRLLTRRPEQIVGSA